MYHFIKLTESQKKFCDEYLIDFNATRAYKVAYPSVKKDETAATAGSRLLRNVKVQEYIQAKQQKLQEKTQITQEKVLNELASIAFFNIKNIYDENGKLKQINDIDNDTAKAICSIKVAQRAGAMKIELGNSDTPIEHLDEQTIEYKMNDKKGALELLGKHLGMFKENVNLTQDKPFEVNINVRK